MLEQGATSGGLSVMEKKLTDLLPGSQGRHVQLSGRDRWDRDLAPGRAAQHEAVGDALHVCFGPGDDPVTCELPEEAGVALDPLTDPIQTHPTGRPLGIECARQSWTQ